MCAAARGKAAASTASDVVTCRFTWPHRSLKTRRAETRARVPARSAVQKADRSEGERAKGELANPKVDRRVTTHAFGRLRLVTLTSYNTTRRDPRTMQECIPQM